MKKLQTILILILAMTVLAGCTASAAMLAPQEEAVSTPTAAVQPEKLTPEEAQAIALADAALTAAETAGLRVEYEREDGVPTYEVDFRAADFEYDYTIHAETGAVLSRSREYDPIATAPPAPLPPATEPATAPPQTETITADRAVAIALAHVGLSQADVTRLEVKYDPDDGIPAYEVEFHHGKTEYDFEIHGITGEILDFDLDK